jgi:hypothetical protein
VAEHGAGREHAVHLQVGPADPATVDAQHSTRAR